MILVLGGTKESRNIIGELLKTEQEVIASVVTEYGYSLLSKFDIEIIREEFSQQDLVEIIREKKIDMIIDATHAFAKRISQNAIKATSQLGIDYLRFENKALEELNHKFIHQVEDYQQAIKEVVNYDKILLLVELDKLECFTKHLKNWQERLIVCVLPTWRFIKRVEKIGIPAQNLIALGQEVSESLSRELLKEYQISAVVVKACGKQKTFENKLKVAAKLEIPSFLIKPAKAITEDVVNEEEQVLRLIK